MCFYVFQQNGEPAEVEWHADEAYEALIDFEWDRHSLHRLLERVVSAPVEKMTRRSSLKVRIL